jgi:hypothetical protein
MVVYAPSTDAQSTAIQKGMGFADDGTKAFNQLGFETRSKIFHELGKSLSDSGVEFTISTQETIEKYLFPVIISPRIVIADAKISPDVLRTALITVNRVANDARDLVVRHLRPN